MTLKGFNLDISCNSPHIISYLHELFNICLGYYLVRCNFSQSTKTSNCVNILMLYQVLCVIFCLVFKIENAKAKNENVSFTLKMKKL